MLAARQEPDAAAIAAQLRLGAQALRAATAAVVALQSLSPRRAAAGAAPYLRLFGLVAGGHAMAAAAAAAMDRLAAGPDAFAARKLASARFFADHWLSQAPGLQHAATDGFAAIENLADDDL
jgi:hypothetical protein